MKLPVFWNRVIDDVLCVGRSLEPTGVHNWALSKKQALAALDSLNEMGVAVLGGDVYSDGLELTYDNWFCDQSKEESDRDFVIRSFVKATEYISRYHREDRLFMLVPKIESPRSAM